MVYLIEDIMGVDVYVLDVYFDGIDSESYVEEVMNSFYIQMEWDFDVKDYLVELIVGLCYEEIDVISIVCQCVEK